MGSPRSQPDAAHWQKRAEEARAIAEQMISPQTRRQMLEIAANYDMLAEEAAKAAPQSATSSAYGDR